MRASGFRKCLSKFAFKQELLNFVTAHPRLTILLAALGISFTFASVGRITINEILQPAYAPPPLPCIECAKEFAPGQEAVLPGDAKDFAPGIVANEGGDTEVPLDAQDVAPGQLKQKDIPE